MLVGFSQSRSKDCYAFATIATRAVALCCRYPVTFGRLLWKRQGHISTSSSSNEPEVAVLFPLPFSLFISYDSLSSLAPDISMAWRPVSELSRNSLNFCLKISKPWVLAALVICIMGPQRLSRYVMTAAAPRMARKRKYIGLRRTVTFC